MSNLASNKSNFRATVYHNYEGCVFVGLVGWSITDPVGPRLMIPKPQLPPTVVEQIDAGSKDFRVSFIQDDMFKFGQWEWQMVEETATQALDVAVAPEDANSEEDVDYGFDPETDGSAYQPGTLEETSMTKNHATDPDTPIPYSGQLAEVHYAGFSPSLPRRAVLRINAYDGETLDGYYQCNVDELPEPIQVWLVRTYAANRVDSFCTVVIPDGMLGDPGEWQFIAHKPEPTIGYETVNHPTHYNWHPKVECIDVIEEFQNVNVAFAIKHLWRLGHKPGVDAQQDLDKAIWYLTREKQRLAQAKED